MKVYLFPDFAITHAVKQYFLEELALRVNNDDNSSDRNVQIIIFLPVSRPLDEFQNVTAWFRKEENPTATGKQNKDVILIKALKQDQKDFEVPKIKRIVYTGSIIIADGGHLDSSSGATVDEIADLLVRNYCFERSTNTCTSDTKIQGESGVSIEDETKEKEITELKKQNGILENKVEELETQLSDQKEQLNQKTATISRLNHEMGMMKIEREEKDSRIEQLEKQMEEQGCRIEHLQKESDGKDMVIAKQRGKVKKHKASDERTSEENDQLKKEIESQRRELEYSIPLPQPGHTTHGHTTSRTICFQLEHGWWQSLLNCFPCCREPTEIILDANAFEMELLQMKRTEYGSYSTCEETFGLKPEELLELLFFLQRFVKTPGNQMLSDHEFDNLGQEVHRKFLLSERNFKGLLKEIYKRKRKQRPL